MSGDAFDTSYISAETTSSIFEDVYYSKSLPARDTDDKFDPKNQYLFVDNCGAGGDTICKSWFQDLALQPFFYKVTSTTAGDMDTGLFGRT